MACSGLFRQVGGGEGGNIPSCTCYFSGMIAGHAQRSEEGVFRMYGSTMVNVASVRDPRAVRTQVRTWNPGLYR